MSDATRTTASAAPAPREPARSSAVEGAPAAAGLSNFALQQQSRAGVSLASIPGAPLDNRSMQSLARGNAPAASFASVKPAVSSASQPLPHYDRIQAAFGRHDVSGVRTITGGPARGANAALGARAFTAGDKIGFRDAPDVWLAAHESAHVVQQRDGASTPGGDHGDPWERHADRVADEVVAGRSAEPLLDAVTGSGPSRAPAVQLDQDKHAQNQPEPFSASSGDKPGNFFSGRGTAQSWMYDWGDLLVDKLGDYLAGTKLEMPSPWAQWSAGAPADFAKAMWAPVVAKKGGNRPYFELPRILAPDALDPLVNAGRDAPTTGPLDPITEHRIEPLGETDWAEPVVAEVGKIVVKRVIESLQREVPRWVSARNQLRLSSEGPIKTVDHDPDPKQVVKSHPIDAYVLGGLTGHVTVDYAAYRKSNPDEAKLGDLHLGELKTVPFDWLHDEGAWNWVHVQVEGATVEDVAYTLYGDSTYAHTMTGAAPYFGVTNVDKLIEPALSLWTKARDHAKKPASEGDDSSISEPDQQIQKPSLVSDYVMLAEANSLKSIKPSGIKPDEDGRKVLLDRMNAGLQTFQLITKMSHKLSKGGYDWMVSDAYKRLQDRAFKVADRTNSMNWIVDWDRQTIAQGDLLRQALNGITVAVAQYNNFSMWDKASLVAQQIGFMYLRVASLSEQAVAGQEALAAANDQSKLFPALVMEQVLAEVRKVLHREEGKNWDVDTSADHDERTDLKEHQDREAKLRLRLARVRDELLQNQEGAAKDLQQLQQDLADLQTEVSLVYDMDAIEAAWQALYNDLSAVGVISGANTDDTELMSGKEGHDTESNPALLDLWSEWNRIYLEYRYGDKKAAIAKLKERKPKLKELLDKVAPLIKSNATKNKWITFAIMIGIALVTAGVGAYVEGAAAVAWGAESWATFAVTTGAEAFTFTTLSYGFVDKDPSIGGYFLELGKNLITFGALKGISNKYISFIGKDVAGTVDTMIVQFVAMNTASLVEADIKKYRATGQHLSLDEALDISKQNALFTIAAGIATAAARPGLETLKLRGEADSALSGLRSAKADLQALALKVESAKTADPAQVEGLLAKQREVLKAQDDALKTLEKLASDPKKASKAGLDDPTTIDRLESARQEHVEAARQLELATTLQYTEGAGPIRYAEKGAKWDSVVNFWKGEGATVETVRVDDQFGSRSVDITTKEGDTFRLLERTADNAKAVGQTGVEIPGAGTAAPKAPDATTATPDPVGGTKSASSYTLSDTPVQTGKKVAAIATDIAPGLKAEGIDLGAVKAEPAKGGSKTASTTLTVPDGKGGTTSVPVTIEVATDVAASGASGHGTESGHASFQIKPDGKGGWTVSIRIEERLANEADVASHLRHELREAKDILGELAKDPTFDVDAAQKSSSLTDPTKTTAHDRAAAAEVRDLLSDLGATIAEGEAARARVAKAGKRFVSKADRLAVQKGADARARLDSLLDSMGLTDPAARAEKIKTVLDLAGVDAASPLGKFLEGYGIRTDATAARTKALDALDAPTRAKVEAALGPYADLLPADQINNFIDAVTKDPGSKFATNAKSLLELRAQGGIDDAQLAANIDSTARAARAAEAETTEAGGKRLYNAEDPDRNPIGENGLSKQQEAKFRGDIDNAKTVEDKMQARYQRYRAKIANAVESTLKAGEPWPFDVWKAKNPQLNKAVSEGLAIENDAVTAMGATPNNKSGAYIEKTVIDPSTNQVVTARPDAFLGDIPVESKYVDAGSKDQVVYDTTQTRAEREMGGEEGHIMVLSQKVKAGEPPAELRPSRPLADKSDVYFFDPGLKKITFRWETRSSSWVPSTGPEAP